MGFTSLLHSSFILDLYTPYWCFLLITIYLRLQNIWHMACVTENQLLFGNW